MRGIQGDEDNIAGSYRERGLPVPAHINEPPRIAEANLLYWSAYADLQHERPPSLPGNRLRRIPWSAIATYATHHRLNVDELKRYIWALDSEFLDASVAPEPEQQPPTHQVPGHG